MHKYARRFSPMPGKQNSRTPHAITPTKTIDRIINILLCTQDPRDPATLKIASNKSVLLMNEKTGQGHKRVTIEGALGSGLVNASAFCRSTSWYLVDHQAMHIYMQKDANDMRQYIRRR